MATQRRKSAADIERQLQRIRISAQRAQGRNAFSDVSNFSRVARATKAADKYIDNIYKTAGRSKQWMDTQRSIRQGARGNRSVESYMGAQKATQIGENGRKALKKNLGGIPLPSTANINDVRMSRYDYMIGGTSVG